MKKIFYSLLISVIALVTLSSCYAMSDDGVMSSIDYNVIVSNGYPHYRDGRVIYYYYNNDYYYRIIIMVIDILEDITERLHLLGDIDLNSQDLIEFHLKHQIMAASEICTEDHI